MQPHALSALQDLPLSRPPQASITAPVEVTFCINGLGNIPSLYLNRQRVACIDGDILVNGELLAVCDVLRAWALDPKRTQVEVQRATTFMRLVAERLEAKQPNCTDGSACPVFVEPPRFAVMATAEFRGTHRTVAPGEFVVIDPRVAPRRGCVVLAGSNLERWQGQSAIRGVAVQWIEAAA